VAVAVVVADGVAVAMWQWVDGAGWVIAVILIGDKLGIERDWSGVANRVAVAMWQWHNRLQWVIAVILIGDKLTIGALWAEFGYKLGGSGSGSAKKC
jgi:hypothetical protein